MWSKSPLQMWTRVSNTSAHDGAVIDEWESDCDTPETEGAVARLPFSASKSLMHRRNQAQAVPQIQAVH